MFSFRIRPLVCKRQNQSGTKTFRIHHEAGTISSSVNLVLNRDASRFSWNISNTRESIGQIPRMELETRRGSGVYYSTNCNTIQIWSWCSRYLSSVGNRYPAVYVASYVGRKSEVKKCRQKDLKMLRALLSICWIIKQLSCSILRNIVRF